MVFSADTLNEVLRWNYGIQNHGTRWLLLRLVVRYHLRCPPSRLGLAELFDRKEDAYACVKYCDSHRGEMITQALQIGHVGAYCRHEQQHLSRDKAIEMLRKACKNGHLEMAKWLAGDFRGKPFGVTAEDVRANYSAFLRLACIYGHLEVAKWLVDGFDLTAEDARALDNLAFRWACEHGHLGVAQWLVERFHLTAEDARAVYDYALRRAYISGHLAVVDFLRKLLDGD